jgi:hypothetical protein
MRRLVVVLCAAWPLAAQPVFDVATVKRGDGGRTVTGAMERGRFHARNTSLLALLCAAFQVPYLSDYGRSRLGTERGIRDRGEASVSPAITAPMEHRFDAWAKIRERVRTR